MMCYAAVFQTTECPWSTEIPFPEISSQLSYSARSLKAKDWCFFLVSVPFWRHALDCLAGWTAEELTCELPVISKSNLL